MAGMARAIRSTERAVSIQYRNRVDRSIRTIQQYEDAQRRQWIHKHIVSRGRCHFDVIRDIFPFGFIRTCVSSPSMPQTIFPLTRIGPAVWKDQRPLPIIFSFLYLIEIIIRDNFFLIFKISSSVKLIHFFINVLKTRTLCNPIIPFF